MRMLFAASLLSLLLAAPLSARAAIHLAQGTMSGEVTASSVLLQTRLTASDRLDASGDLPGAPGVACFEWSTSGEFADAQRTPWSRATAESDFIVRAALRDLRPGTTYYYRAIYGGDAEHAEPGPVCEFRTLPVSDSHAAVSFVMGSCMNYTSFMLGKKSRASGPITATEEDRQLGYPAFAAIDALAPHFFIGTGDIVYYDHLNPAPAQTLEELRKCWHEQFRFPRMIDLFRHTPAYWSKDDHDFRFNDSDLVGDKLPLPETGIDLFREQMPILAAGDRSTPTYRTHRINRDLQLWFTEGRDYRSPNRMPDGPEKSLWGSEQREWLKRTLKESDATWKILITPTPMVGPDDAYKKDNHTNLEGFRHEAEQFFAWLKENEVNNLLTFCGDRHWQYHSIHPSGVEEFSCGALNDENSRRGVAPGSKRGTDPDALIDQPYTYDQPTGGFLQVTSEPQGSAEGANKSRLVIEFRDDTGRVLHRVVKHPSQN
ncbi:alkaline phosphatase D family protein [Candidatus Laterigemmans baculatus]|uniref:alkaline phosphatase D family protein n=1 Tax=Candidatus Laterigemmans baculatus TaxID=2770505 RepID=UPI001F248147|nr:alkaline phosphatase D family protein [Candidatus Laterigemmans baculatus]